MDKDIEKKLKEQDEQALLLIKETYLSLMYYILQPFPLSEEDKEECINDVLVRIWNHEFQENLLSMKNYVALITRRVGLNYVSRNKKDLSFYDNMDIFGNLDDYETFDWDFILNKLSTKEQILFTRRFYYFQSVETISLELGLTKRSVESHLYRLKKKLRKILKEAGYHE